MSKPTYHGDATGPGDWSRVFTSLDWVALWMSDRGYTDAEIAYVIDGKMTPVPAAEVAFGPAAEVAFGPVDEPGQDQVGVQPLGDVVEGVGTPETVGTSPLTVEPDTGPGETASDDIDDPEASESLPA